MSPNTKDSITNLAKFLLANNNLSKNRQYMSNPNSIILCIQGKLIFKFFIE